jgi:hypothetical protein
MGGFITLLVVTFSLIIAGYLVAIIAWYIKNREESEAKGVRGAYSGERGPRAEAATGGRSGSVIPGSGHA